MALEKPTRGKPVREIEILLLGNLQQNSEIFRPTYLNLEEKISALFSMPNRKNQTHIFFFVFCLYFCGTDFEAVWLHLLQSIQYGFL